MSVKKKKLLTSLARLAANPQTHDQDNWGMETPCGTTFCIAGDAGMNEPGYESCWHSVYDPAINDDIKILQGFIKPDGVYVDAMSAGAEIFGLNYSQAGVLFHQTRDLQEVALIVLVIKGKNK